VAIDLSEEWQQAITDAFVDGFPIVWASTGADGQANLNFFGTTQALNNHQIALWMRTPERGFLKRIGENPQVAMLFRNPKTRLSLHIHGEAHHVDDPAIKQQVWENSAEVERNADPEMKGTAVIVDVVRVIQRGQVVMER